MAGVLKSISARWYEIIRMMFPIKSIVIKYKFNLLYSLPTTRYLCVTYYHHYCRHSADAGLNKGLKSGNNLEGRVFVDAVSLSVDTAF